MLCGVVEPNDVKVSLLVHLSIQHFGQEQDETDFCLLQ